jgi:two-component system, chemotaxis family, sensor kinase Cph1
MLTQGATAQKADFDLTNCDREPIHIPGSIQPHGVLLVLDERNHSVLQASENAAPLLLKNNTSLIGKSLTEILSESIVQSLQLRFSKAPSGAHPLFLQSVTLNECVFDVVAHRSDAGLILELELSDTTSAATVLATDLHLEFDDFSLRAETISSVHDLCQQLARTVRRMTGFDRVLVYQFDDEWNGKVVGEDGNGRLPEYFNHHFPASDIPAQARELYRLNRVRIIPDAGYTPVRVLPAVNPATGRSLDLTYSTLRSVSPIHVEYMRNMETMSSMSVSILRSGTLWGLISCHHREPRMASVTVRTTCDLIARAFALRLSALEHARHYERRIEVRSTYSKLLAVMAERGDYAAALAEHSDDMLTFAAAEGAAVLTEGECLLLGKTPSEQDVRELANWLFSTIKEEIFSTECLSQVKPDALRLADTASGLLAVAVSKLHPSYLMWFRPEVVQTIEWGGDPHKPMTTDNLQMRMHPRKSFDTWKQTVRNQSLPWDDSEVESATELRNAIVGIVLRKAEELADLNAELTRSNKELEAFSYSVSHDLRAPLRHIVGYAEMLRESGENKLTANQERCVGIIIESSEYAGKLVDKLLGYSRLGRADLQLSLVDLPRLMDELRTDVMRDAGERHVTWKVAQLPLVTADLMMLRMAVRDLLANAVKYTREREDAVIEIGCEADQDAWTFSVKDNGVGFDMQYADKLFGVFQRLHRWEDYEGTGIGLANVRRVIERHGGRTWAQGKEGMGATFFFTLPKSIEQKG